MKTDKLFYQIFLTQPNLIAELLPDIPTDCEFEYSAPVVKEKEIRLDGLMTPTQADPNLPLVFLEAQMQSDPGFYGRFFAGIFLYLQQYPQTRSWRGLLILQNRSLQLGCEVPYSILLEHHVKRLYLDDLLLIDNLSPNLAILKLLVIPEENAFAEAQDILDKANTTAEFQACLNLVEAILVYKRPTLSIEEVKNMLDLKEASLRDTRFFQQARQEGRQEGEVDVLLRFLTKRVGSLSKTSRTAVRTLSCERLEALAEDLLDFTEISDLENWLGF